VGKCISYRCQIFSGCHTPKIIKISLFLTVIWKNKKVDVFLGHSVVIDAGFVWRYEPLLLTTWWHGCSPACWASWPLDPFTHYQLYLEYALITYWLLNFYVFRVWGFLAWRSRQASVSSECFSSSCLLPWWSSAQQPTTRRPGSQRRSWHQSQAPSGGLL